MRRTVFPVFGLFLIFVFSTGRLQAQTATAAFADAPNKTPFIATFSNTSNYQIGGPRSLQFAAKIQF